MPEPVAQPTSSPDIVAISPPPKRSRHDASPESKTKRRRSSPTSSKQASSRNSTRSRVTERMLNSLASPNNPITHSDSFTRTQHVVSCATGHQQRNGDRGFWANTRTAGVGGVAGEAHTYWSVRTSKVEQQGREAKSSIFSGCVVAINGHTGPVSNLQLQNLITSNGGKFSPHQHSGCTHIVAERLAGGKTQKYIKGQGSRGASRRTKMVKVEWVIDSAKQGKRLSEAGYTAIEDPSQQSLFSALGVKPKSQATVKEESSGGGN